MKIKEEFHHLIDSIEDEAVLKAYFQLVQSLNIEQSGDLFNKLTDEQKRELLLADDESSNEENLISHDDVKAEYSKWLKK